MPDRNRIFPRSATFWIVLAGAVVVGLGIAYFLIRTHDGVGGTIEQDMLVAPRDGATISSMHTRFRWQRSVQSTAYSFFIYHVDRTLVWSALVRDTSLALPQSVQLQRGSTYLWRVEAIMPDETTIRSELHAFTLSQ